MSAPVKRAQKVADRVRAELMEMLLRGEIKDPRVHNTTVTHVHVTDDLQLAKVYVRAFAIAPSTSDQERVVKAFRSAGGFIRRNLGARLKLKYTPELKFFWDEGAEDAEHMERVLAEVRAEEGWEQ